MSQAKTDPNPLVSAGIVTERLGVSPQLVHKLAAEGKLPRVGPGRYPLRECIRAYLDRLRERAQFGDVSGEYSLHRARLVKARADAAEIEAKRLGESLLPAREVEAVWLALIMASKERFTGLGARVVPRLKGLDDRERKVILDAEIDAAFNALAGGRIVFAPQ